MTSHFPRHGRVAAVDYGTVRIGVAISDINQVLASPHSTYQRQNDAADAEWFRRLVEQEEIVGFVVGLPVFASGQPSPKSEEAKRFGQWLADVTGRPVRFFDERYTSVEADQVLAQGKLTRRQRKARRDRIAAQILLAAYLESADRPPAPPGPLDDPPQR